MTPEERAVIEAARALLQEYGPPLPSSGQPYWDLYAAVAALPVPLAERLPGLRPGAVVELVALGAHPVLFNHPPSGRLLVDYPDCPVLTTYDNITSIVSEAPDA